MTNHTKMNAVTEAILEDFAQVNCLTRGVPCLMASDVHDDLHYGLCMDNAPSLTTVRRHLKAMVARGELDSVEQQDDSERWVTRYYLPGTVPEVLARIARERKEKS